MTMPPDNAKLEIRDGGGKNGNIKRNSVSSLDSWDAVFDVECTAENEHREINSSKNAIEVVQRTSSTGSAVTFKTDKMRHGSQNIEKCLSHLDSTGNLNNASSITSFNDTPAIACTADRDKVTMYKSKSKPLRDKYVSTVLGHNENKMAISHHPKSKPKLPNPSSVQAKIHAKFENKSTSDVKLKPFTKSQPVHSPSDTFSKEKRIFMRQISAKSSSLPMNSSLINNDSFGKASSGDQTEKVKTKLLSVWNNVKYGWTMPTRANFTVSTFTILLGQVYHDVENCVSNNSAKNQRYYGGVTLGRPVDTPIEKFKLDFTSRIWLTYRRDFLPLLGSSLTTDCGWGCMLRSGQMLLAQALVCHFLSRSWRCAGVPQAEKSETLHRTIVKWFADSPSTLCPLSLHHLVAIGTEFGKKPGDWFGPASSAHILKKAIEDASTTSPLLDEVCVYVAQDCTVYEEDVIKLCTAPSHVVKMQKPRGSVTSLSSRSLYSRQNSVEEVIEWADVLKSPEEERNTKITQKCSLRLYDSALPSPPLSPLNRTWSNPSLLDSGSQHLKYSDDNDLPSLFTTNRSIPTDMRPTREILNSYSGEKWRGLIILIPVRLGGEKLNPIYIPCLKRILAHESCLGIIGGKPKHALYFVGYQDDKLIHLDPHYCQETIDIRSSDFSLSSFHCTIPKKIPLGKMDPSCTMGFYLRTRDDFDTFSKIITPLLTPGSDGIEYPMFVISKGSRKNILVESIVENEELYSVNNHSSSDSESEEAFVLL